ncbi:MAG: REP-associated tyrosine transposase [Planctomycetota bacterium]
MVTYRLGDALPKAVAERLARGLDARAPEGEYRRRIESYLDSGFGACLLSRAEVASCVRETWLKFDRDRSLLHGRVIMPNHVHVVVETRTEYSLGAVVKGWKSVTARGIHRICGSRGRVWQEEYWDRFIRDRSHYRSAMQYMAENPVKAKLVYRPEDWSWSSFSKKQE